MGPECFSTTLRMLGAMSQLGCSLFLVGVNQYAFVAGLWFVTRCLAQWSNRQPR